MTVVGAFTGFMIDNLIHSIKVDLESANLFHSDWTPVEDGVEKMSKLECVRVVRGANKLPSVMTEAELDATWLNPDWNPRNDS